MKKYSLLLKQLFVLFLTSAAFIIGLHCLCLIFAIFNI